MKKLLVSLLSLYALNSFAQDNPQLDLEKQKRMQEFLAKEIEKMPDPLPAMEAQNKERQMREFERKRRTEYEKSEEYQMKIKHINLFKVMMKEYNALDNNDKMIYRKSVAKPALNMFITEKNKHLENIAFPSASGDDSKITLTFTQNTNENFNKNEIDYWGSNLIQQFSKKVCEDYQLLALLGVDISLEGVFKINDKVASKITMTKKDCKYMDFSGKY